MRQLENDLGFEEVGAEVLFGVVADLEVEIVFGGVGLFEVKWEVDNNPAIMVGLLAHELLGFDNEALHNRVVINV